ncbi:hypothetical protein [Sediminibacter sp. Hel_I_10]|uniref:hypothetical protein n=1 Tax=Sediminibacter sp. Hel_I_10 TaxID=1392490 RepID=UPI00047D82E2|nr:hypothetical protein [Sediminibacter sp. Hel_I_10]
MKTTLTILFIGLLNFTSLAQDKPIETKSITLDQLIGFTVDQIKVRDTSSTKLLRQYCFLIETPTGVMAAEDKVILKQAFRLISKRMNATDSLSIVTYSGYSGLALEQSSAKNNKSILYAIEHLEKSQLSSNKDGISLAYDYMNDHFIDNAENLVIMVRNPNASQQVTNDLNNSNISASNAVPNKKNSAVLITAIALLPELISVIKD